MSAISRKSLTPLRSCCKTSSEKTRTRAAWCMASQAFRSAPQSSWKSFSRWRGKRFRDAGTHRSVTEEVFRSGRKAGEPPRERIAGPSPRKGMSHETPDVLSHDTDRRALHLLQRGRPERRADASPTARTSLFIADVRAALRPACRSLSPCRARLPGLRTQRLAGPETLRVYVRSLRRDHESLHRGARALALHAVHAGLRSPGGFSHGPSLSRPNRGPDRPERCGAHRRPGSELGGAAGFLGRSGCQRMLASHQSPVAADDANAPCRERPQRGTL